METYFVLFNKNLNLHGKIYAKTKKYITPFQPVRNIKKQADLKEDLWVERVLNIKHTDSIDCTACHLSSVSSGR